MTLETNIKIRLEAEAAFQLAKETADAMPEDQCKQFWAALYFYVARVAGVVPDKDPVDSPAMTEAQANAFACSYVPDRFRLHAEKPVGEVPLSYWFFIIEDPDDFVSDLRRYLRSDRVQMEQDDE